MTLELVGDTNWVKTKIAVAVTVFSGQELKVLNGFGNDGSLLNKAFKYAPLLKDSSEHIGLFALYKHLSDKVGGKFFGQTSNNKALVLSVFEYATANLAFSLCPSASQSCLAEKLEELNTFFVKNTFFVEDTLTVADVAVAVVIEAFLVKNLVDAVSFAEKYFALKRWHETITSQDLYKKYLCTLKSASSLTGVLDPEEEEGEGPKAKDPLDLLPPTKLNLEEWKRVYSNNKTKLFEVAMPWFWDNYDPEGWCLYKVKYDKLEDECKVSFLTSNMLSGFLQRFPPNFRKYSFATMHVLGSGNNFDIAGLWLFRGNEIPAQVIEHPSYEYHVFTRLDHTDQQTKKLVEEYWCSETTVEGVNIESSVVWK